MDCLESLDGSFTTLTRSTQVSNRDRESKESIKTASDSASTIYSASEVHLEDEFDHDSVYCGPFCGICETEKSDTHQPSSLSTGIERLVPFRCPAPVLVQFVSLFTNSVRAVTRWILPMAEASSPLSRMKSERPKCEPGQDFTALPSEMMKKPYRRAHRFRCSILIYFLFAFIVASTHHFPLFPVSYSHIILVVLVCVISDILGNPLTAAIDGRWAHCVASARNPRLFTVSFSKKLSKMRNVEKLDVLQALVTEASKVVQSMDASDTDSLMKAVQAMMLLKQGKPTLREGKSSNEVENSYLSLECKRFFK